MLARNLAAVLAATALSATCLAVPGAGEAHADITPRRFSVEVTTGAESGFHTADVNKGRVSWLYFNHTNPAVRILQNAVSIDATGGGVPVTYSAEDTEVTHAPSTADTADAAETVTLTHVDERAQVEMVRTFRVTAQAVDVDVRLRNLADTERELTVSLAHGTVDADQQVSATRDGNAFDLQIGEAYQLRSEFPEAQHVGTGSDRDQAKQHARDGATSEDARYQAGEFSDTVAPGETLHAHVTLRGTAADALNDSDGDGFPDRWELEGFTTSENTEFPLHVWGADPHRPDLFLQLNWMKSEWETLGCAQRTHYAPTPEDFAAFTACSRANTNTYAPSRESLNQLVEVFDQQGMHLLIDAGEHYTNIPGYTDHHGGATEDYAEYYFNGASISESPAAKLLAERDRLLGARADVFRVGIIGGQQSPGNMSSGTGLVRDGAFYVSKNALMTSQEQLRNSILHEYGHNLGLTHSGAYNVPRPNSSYVPNYRSVMNYLYQFAYFDYSEEQARPDEHVPLPRACTNGTVTCYDGDYDIAPDWNHIELVNGKVGSAEGTAGTSTGGGSANAEDGGSNDPETSTGEHETSHQTDVTVRDLEKNAAEFNDGKAGFRVLNDPDAPNVIVANRADSTVQVELSNLGIHPHRYTVQASYPGGEWTGNVDVASALSDASKHTVTIPITQTAGYSDATMPIQFRVYNEHGRLVADDTQDFSVLTYTKAQMQSLIDELERTGSPLLADAQAAIGKPDKGPGADAGSGPGSGSGSATATPVPTRPNSTLTAPTRAPGITDLGPAEPNRGPEAPATEVPATEAPVTTTAGTTSAADPADPTAAPSDSSASPPTAEPQRPASDSGPADNGTGGSSTTGIAIGVVLALLTALGIGAGVAAQAGLI